ncbi:reverse transcriptase domain, reverse transcriptase zinc-binding domain protein [Tanacetum coccineum]|uniref:Reverse transcriptase domain, reverse transcriptase zinc-binding domain protein n=1 Tax=Tanacetum coccineum TaxID=301880 RepID=A0ABQ4WNA4_9ASTR
MGNETLIVPHLGELRSCCQKEGRIISNVHRLLRIKQADGTCDQVFISSSTGKRIFQRRHSELGMVITSSKLRHLVVEHTGGKNKKEHEGYLKLKIHKRIKPTRDLEFECSGVCSKDLEALLVWDQLLSDYDCEIRYHPGKANVVVDALSRKERIKPLRVRVLVMTIGLDLPKQILNAQTKQEEIENLKNEDVGGWIHDCQHSFRIEGGVRCIEIEENAVNSELMRRSVEGAISEYVSKVGGVEDKMDGNNMQIDNGVREDGEDDEESNSEGSEGSSDEEGEYEDEGSEDEENRGNRSDMNFGNRNGGEDDGSRYSGKIKVGDTFEVDLGNSKEMAVDHAKDMYGECNATNQIVSPRKEGPTEELINNGYENNQKVVNKKVLQKENESGLNLDHDVGQSDGLVIEKENGLYGSVSTRPIGKKSNKNNRMSKIMDGNIDDKKHSYKGKSCEDNKMTEVLLHEGGFDGAEIEKNFNQGKSNVDNVGTKKKVGRRSVKKATKVARKTRVKGLGENKKGIFDAYKEYHEVESESIAMRWELDAEKRALNDVERETWMEARKRMNNKCNLRGLMVNGMWCEDPKRKGSVGCYSGLWGDKAPSPDGFNFKFIRKMWEIIKPDLMGAISWFWEKMEISKGCNTSFVTIIPKVVDHIGLGDYRPISLIGCYYKIIAKMLAERVKRVVGDVVDKEQNAFIKGRFILDGVLIANETIKFLRKTKEKGSTSMSILVNGSPSEEFELERGVRQGDPLSPFLFILAAKGLNSIVNEVVTNVKWWWRFREEGNGLWVRVIKSIHGDDRGLGGNNLMGGGESSVWHNIVKVGEELDGLGLEFSSSFVGVLGDGRDIRFWVDRDMWRWVQVEDGVFKVKELTRLVEEKILHVESGGQETISNKLVPKKVNIFVWRARKGRLSVRVELDRRGINLDSVLCPSCNNVVESCAHSLVTCDLAMSMWEKVFSWWKLRIVNSFSIDEFFSSLGNVNVPGTLARVWQAVIWTFGHLIWKERNAHLFDNKISSTNKIMQDIQLKIFEWIVRRSKKYKEFD